MRVGKRDLVLSGTVVTQEGDDTVEFNYLNLQFKIIFQSNVDQPGPAVNPDVSGWPTTKIVF